MMLAPTGIVTYGEFPRSDFGVRYRLVAKTTIEDRLVRNWRHGFSMLFSHFHITGNRIMPFLADMDTQIL